MEYRRYGKSGIKVSKVSLGTMSFGRWIDEKASEKILHYALDQGMNLIDTADIYGRGMDDGKFEHFGESEVILGNLLNEKRKHVLISTKLTNRIGPFINDAGQSRYHIYRAVEGSLRRLKTDYIDILHVHRFDPESSFEESLRAFDDLISHGKVRYIACSNFSAWQIAKAHGVSALHDFARFESVQSEYSLISRNIENEIIPFAQSEQIAILAFSPLGRGILAGKYSLNTAPPPDSRLAAGEKKLKELINQRNIYEYIAELEQIAKQKGWTLPQLAFNWVANHKQMTSTIIGGSKTTQLQETLKYVNEILTEEELQFIEQAYNKFKFNKSEVLAL